MAEQDFKTPASALGQPARAPGGEHLHVVAFRSGQARFVIDVYQVAAVLGGAQPQAHVAGDAGETCVAWQGSAVPVVHLESMLRPGAGARQRPRAQERLLVCKTEAGLVALCVDEVMQVFLLTPEGCLASDPSNPRPARYSLGCCRLGGELYGFFDLTSLAAALRASRAQGEAAAH